MTGDVVFVWGTGIISKIISFLQYTVYGIKDGPTHVQIGLTSLFDMSADEKGIHTVLRDETKARSRKYLVARKKCSLDRPAFVDIIMDYRGKGYDFSWYALAFMRFFLIFAPLVWFVLHPLKRWLKQRSQKTFICSEFVAQVWKDYNLYCFGLDEPSFAVPQNLLTVVLAGEGTDWEIIEAGGRL